MEPINLQDLKKDKGFQKLSKRLQKEMDEMRRRHQKQRESVQKTQVCLLNLNNKRLKYLNLLIFTNNIFRKVNKKFPKISILNLFYFKNISKFFTYEKILSIFSNAPWTNSSSTINGPAAPAVEQRVAVVEWGGNGDSRRMPLPLAVLDRVPPTHTTTITITVR